MIESIQNAGAQALAAAQAPKEAGAKVEATKVEATKVEATPIKDTVKISPEAKEKLKEEEATVTTEAPPVPEAGAKIDPQMATAVKAYTAA